MGKPAIAIELTATERAELEGLAGRRRTAQGLAKRARIVLAAAAGSENKVIARSLGADENTVGKWRRRFAERRLDGLYDEPRSGAPRQIEDAEIGEIVRLTLETAPPDATHWSLRSMAAAVGHAPSTVQRIWKAFCLQPHRSDTFKLSTDPLFVEKVRDIVGLYMAPPERAVVLCLDEAAITDYIATVNANPRPFVWTKSADDILASIKRFCLATLKTAEIQTQIGKTSESGH